jgi:hypothetical protein
VNPIPYILPFFLTFSSGRQWQPFVKEAGNYPKHISLNTHAELNGQNINSEFLYAVGQGNFLSEDLKTSLLPNNNTKHELGFEWNTDFSFLNLEDSLFGSPNWGYYISANQRFIGNGNLTNDALGLLLNGNGKYRGQELNVSGSSVDFLSFQKINVGFIKTWHPKKEKGWHTQFGFAIGLVNGNLHRNLTIESGKLFTEVTGDFIKFSDMNIQYLSSTSDENRWLYPNGTGASSQIMIEMGNHKHLFSFSINDLGFIQWNDRSENINLGGTFIWEGLPIPPLSNLTDTFVDEFIDSLKSEYSFTNSRNDYVRPLPFHLRIGYVFNAIHYSVIGQIDWLPTLQTIPRFTCGITTNRWSSFQPGLSIGYGGWSRFHYGFDLSFLIKKSWILSLQSRQISGWVPNRIDSGWQAGIRLSKSF